MEHNRLQKLTMQTKLTQQQQYQQKADALKWQICQLLSWSHDDYCNYQYKCGLSYLAWYAPANETLRRQLEGSKLFWNWFKNVWTVYDESLLSFTTGLQECSQQTRRSTYETLHCPRTMAVEEKPFKAVLDSVQTKSKQLCSTV
jgi:hypothetical protein